jgi:hypothetical protein
MGSPSQSGLIRPRLVLTSPLGHSRCSPLVERARTRPLLRAPEMAFDPGRGMVRERFSGPRLPGQSSRKKRRSSPPVRRRSMKSGVSARWRLREPVPASASRSSSAGISSRLCRIGRSHEVGCKGSRHSGSGDAGRLGREPGYARTAGDSRARSLGLAPSVYPSYASGDVRGSPPRRWSPGDRVCRSVAGEP